MAVLKILILFLLISVRQKPARCDDSFSRDDELTRVRTKNLSGNVLLTTLQVFTTHPTREFDSGDSVIETTPETITENQHQHAALSDIGTKRPTDGEGPFLMDVFNSTSGTLPDWVTEKRIAVGESVTETSTRIVPEMHLFTSQPKSDQDISMSERIQINQGETTTSDGSEKTTDDIEDLSTFMRLDEEFLGNFTNGADDSEELETYMSSLLEKLDMETNTREVTTSDEILQASEESETNTYSTTGENNESSTTEQEAFNKSIFTSTVRSNKEEDQTTVNLKSSAPTTETMEEDVFQTMATTEGNDFRKYEILEAKLETTTTAGIEQQLNNDSEELETYMSLLLENMDMDINTQREVTTSDDILQASEESETNTYSTTGENHESSTTEQEDSGQEAFNESIFTSTVRSNKEEHETTVSLKSSAFEDLDKDAWTTETIEEDVIQKMATTEDNDFRKYEILKAKLETTTIGGIEQQLNNDSEELEMYMSSLLENLDMDINTQREVTTSDEILQVTSMSNTYTTGENHESSTTREQEAKEAFSESIFTSTVRLSEEVETTVSLKYTEDLRKDAPTTEAIEEDVFQKTTTISSTEDYGFRKYEKSTAKMETTTTGESDTTTIASITTEKNEQEQSTISTTTFMNNWNLFSETVIYNENQITEAQKETTTNQVSVSTESGSDMQTMNGLQQMETPGEDFTTLSSAGIDNTVTTTSTTTNFNENNSTEQVEEAASTTLHQQESSTPISTTTNLNYWKLDSVSSTVVEMNQEQTTENFASSIQSQTEPTKIFLMITTEKLFASNEDRNENNETNFFTTQIDEATENVKIYIQAVDKSTTNKQDEITETSTEKEEVNISADEVDYDTSYQELDFEDIPTELYTSITSFGTAENPFKNNVSVEVATTEIYSNTLQLHNNWFTMEGIMDVFKSFINSTMEAIDATKDSNEEEFMEKEVEKNVTQQDKKPELDAFLSEGTFEEIMKEETIKSESSKRTGKNSNIKKENFVSAEMLKNSETPPQINTTIHGKNVSFSVKIVQNETSYFIPSDAHIRFDSPNTVNITWKSTAPNMNNSLQIIRQHSVQLAIVKGTQMHIHEATLTPHARNTFEEADTELITLDDGVQIYVSSQGFHDEHKPVEFSSDDLTAEITGGCVGICVIAALVSVAVKKYNSGIRNFKPNNSVPV